MIGPTTHNENPFGDCPCCGSNYATVDIEKKVVGRDKDGFPSVFWHSVTLTCCQCGQEFFMEGYSMAQIYRQWDELRKEIIALNGRI